MSNTLKCTKNTTSFLLFLLNLPMVVCCAIQMASDLIFSVVLTSIPKNAGSDNRWHKISIKSTGVGLETSQTSSDRIICSIRWKKVRKVKIKLLLLFHQVCCIFLWHVPKPLMQIFYTISGGGHGKLIKNEFSSS